MEKSAQVPFYSCAKQHHQKICSTFSRTVLLQFALQLSIQLSPSLSPNSVCLMLGKGTQNDWREILRLWDRSCVCVHVCRAHRYRLLLKRWHRRAVSSLMDGMVTYVDPAETASRYSFQLTGLHSGGEAQKVKQEWDKIEKKKGKKKEESCWKRWRSMVHPFFHSLPNGTVYPQQQGWTLKKSSGWGFHVEKRCEMIR